MKTRVINSDELNVADNYTDARYLHQKTKVIPSEKIGEFSVKQWPMLDEGDDKLTNALGYSFDYFKNKRKAQELEAQRQQELKEQEAQKAQAVEAQFQEIDADLANNVSQITAAELEDLRKACEEEGHKSGFDAGFKEGLSKGIDEGKAQGHQEGYDEGIKQGLNEGVKKGLEQGYEEGRQKGLKDCEAIVTEQTERFRHLADALCEPLRELDSEVTYEVVRMASALFKTLAGRELKADQDFLIRTLNNAVAKLPVASKNITIKLNADDLMLVETAMGRDYIKAQHWILQEDASLNPGDVVVTDGKSEVSSLIDERIDKLIADFLDEASGAIDDARAEKIALSPDHEEMLERQENKDEGNNFLNVDAQDGVVSDLELQSASAQSSATAN